VLAFLGTFTMSLPPTVLARTCSNATGAGRWEFTVTGTIILPTGAAVPVAQVGSYTADKAGNIIGSQTRILGGNVAEETFTATASTNPDCTGKATVYVYDKQSGTLVRTSTLDVVFVDEGREARAIVTAVVLPNGTNLGPVLTIEYKRVFFGRGNFE
jgi:hypothetical protein